MLTPEPYTMLYFNFRPIKLEGGIKRVNQISLIMYIYITYVSDVCVCMIHRSNVVFSICHISFMKA